VKLIKTGKNWQELDLVFCLERIGKNGKKLVRFRKKFGGVGMKGKKWQGLVKIGKIGNSP